MPRLSTLECCNGIVKKFLADYPKILDITPLGLGIFLTENLQARFVESLSKKESEHIDWTRRRRLRVSSITLRNGFKIDNTSDAAVGFARFSGSSRRKYKFKIKRLQHILGYIAGDLKAKIADLDISQYLQDDDYVLEIYFNSTSKLYSLYTLECIAVGEYNYATDKWDWETDSHICECYDFVRINYRDNNDAKTITDYLNGGSNNKKKRSQAV